MKLAIQKFLQKGRFYDASGFTQDGTDLDVSALAPASAGKPSGSAQWRSSPPQAGGRGRGSGGGKMDGGRGGRPAVAGP
eukprot:4461014-Heterocapsa_arctica.AAC.1